MRASGATSVDACVWSDVLALVLDGVCERDLGVRSRCAACAVRCVCGVLCVRAEGAGSEVE